DLYVLALPLSQGHEALALLAFLGGLSAATGMVVVSTLTLSLMVGNHWFAPGLLRGAWSRRGGGDLRGNVLTLRRVGIVLVMLLAWAYSRLVAGNEALADVGAVSFSALATLVPALGFAVWRPQTPPRAATLGVLAGFAVWCWVVLVPMGLALSGQAPACSAAPRSPCWSRCGRWRCSGVRTAASTPPPCATPACASCRASGSNRCCRMPRPKGRCRPRPKRGWSASWPRCSVRPR